MRVTIICIAAVMMVGLLCSSNAGCSPTWDGGILWSCNSGEELAAVNSAADVTPAQQQVQKAVNALRTLRMEGFISDCKVHLDANPDSAIAHFALGYAYLLITDIRYKKTMGCTETKQCLRNGAKDELAKALELDQDLQEARLALAVYYIRICPVKAVPILDELLKRDPNNAEAHYWLSQVYLQSTRTPSFEDSVCYDLDKGIKCLERAVEIKPEWLRPRRFLASLYIQRGFVKYENGKCEVDEPWRSKAISQYNQLAKLANAQKKQSDAEDAHKLLAQIKVD